MVSGKAEKPSKPQKKKTSFKNPKSHTNFKNIKKQPPATINPKNKNKNKKNDIHQINDKKQHNNKELSPASASQQLSFFIDEFQSANGLQLSSLELESIKETSFLELSKELGQDVNALGKQMKAAFGSSWKEVLCERQLVEGKIEAGNPAVLIISTSALRVIEILRGVRSLTKECHAAKLFSKHMKVEEQVTLLEDRVNFASGTPSRVKKLIDIEALGLSRLAVVVLDIHTDVKGYSLLTLPQVRCVKVPKGLGV
ncbi:protein CMSS1 isoform X2 [Ricinus communis]|uniref:protein CMSS1 isoform X2 n=1 Tax=Ricinus communis TaxID=3988 RepID=UPI00201AD70B|nr:protein CMSS1 isoform X2 [Ricinus communis]